MSKVLVGALVGLLVGAALAWTVLTHRRNIPSEAEEEHAEASPVFHTNGQTFLRLDPDARRKAGLTLAPLEAATLKPEVKGFGRVLDPAPLAALVIESAAARAALEAATKEFQRLKLLSQDQNASVRALEIATAAAQQNQIAVEAAQFKLLSGWGQAVAAQPDLPGFVHSLVAQETALARIDLPLGQTLNQTPNGGRIAALTAEDQPFEAEFLGPAPNADPLTQGRGFFFLLRHQRLPPDAAVTGWLTVPGDSQSGVIVPRSAVVRHNGAAFVYLEAGDGLFQRWPIELAQPSEKGWFVPHSLNPGGKIVTIGAQQLLSEELKGQEGEE